MKSKIAMSIAIIVMLLAAIPAVAFGITSGKGTASAAARAASSQPAAAVRTADRPAAVQAIRAEVSRLRDQIRRNAERNRALQLEIRSQRQELQDRFAEAKPNLSPAALAQLKTGRQSVRALVQELAETRGQIKAIQGTFKALIEQKDWASLRTACQQILSIQESRYAKLNQISRLLKEMLKLAK